MKLDDFVLLASDTARTKAYIQAMIRGKRLPGLCVVYSDQIERMQEETEQYQESENLGMYFDLSMPVLYAIKKVGIPYILIDNKDINSDRMLDTLSRLRQKYIIYSGYGGYILKPQLFQIGKKFIHVHAGILPQYRGSTTVYYSFLQEKIFGATAIFLSEGIDEGEIITQRTFEVPEEPVNIDYIYEPYLRSQVLIDVLNQYVSEKCLKGKKQNAGDAETYFIIHPVLKHLALLGIEKMQN